MPGEAYAYVSSESLTVSTSAVSLTVPTPSNQSIIRVICQVQAADIRSRIDIAPTTSIGQIHVKDERFVISGIADINGIEFIRDGSSDAVL